MATITRDATLARPSGDAYEQVTKVAHEAIEAGMPVYIRSSGRVSPANAAAAGTSDVLGFASMSVAAGEALAVILRGRMTGWASMTPGTPVWLNDGAGVVGTVTGTTGRRIALALTATELYAMCPVLA
jgi:hypothetical protein